MVSMQNGGDNFAVLVDENNEILICLHKWGNTNTQQ